MARHFGEVATRVIALDLFVFRIAGAAFQREPVHRYIKDNFNPNDLTRLYHGIDEAGLTAPYVALLAEAIVPSDRAVVIDGLLTDRQTQALAEQLRGRAIIWDATRIDPPG